MKYQIECGTIADFVEAKNHEIAFKKLVKKYKNPPLAKLMRFREVDEENQPLRNPHFGKSDIGKWKYQNPIAILRIKKK